MADPVAALVSALADRYRLERELGAGGMATVYLAQDLRHNRKVALKVLRPELALAVGPERFLREIAITARLDHPNIIPLLDSGSAAGFLYYVMPFVDGESLDTRLTREPQLPLDEALRITREVADALGYAHGQHLIHRDIKPGNILLAHGHARVADFGIARALDAAGGEKLTESGLAVGTPAYMSPEQSAGEATLDGRSDLYALGCVLFEMLAGEPPYDGPTAQAIIAKRMTQPVPSVRALRETVPDAVDRAVMTVLAKSPADRFATSAAFANALSDPGGRAVPATTPSSQTGRRQWFLPATLLSTLTVIGVLLVMYSRRPTITAPASVIAVLPFLPSGSDTALARLGRDLALTISANLDGVGGIRTVDPHQVLSRADGARSGQGHRDAIALGKSLGAGSVVMGDLVRLGSAVQLDLKLVSTGGDSVPLARVSVNAPPDSIRALTDSVTWSVLRQVWRRGEPPSPSYATLTTRSVPSLRAFLDGERLSEAGNWPAAADAYAVALKADSNFWLAGWRYNMVQMWIEGERDTTLTRGYESHLAAFGPRDRLLIEAEMSAGLASSEAAYLAKQRAIAERFPGDWAAGFTYADELFHPAPLFGYTNAEVRRELQRLVNLNPKLFSMWEHLARASASHDSAQCARAVDAMMALGGFAQDTKAFGFDASLFYRMLPNGGRSAVQLDSIVAGLAGSKSFGAQVLASWHFLITGFPAAQIELSRRRVARSPHDPDIPYAWKTTAIAWAARGAWDSALGAIDRHAALSPNEPSAVTAYRLALVGAWLAGLDTAEAVSRRAAAISSLDRVPAADSSLASSTQLEQGWGDGMLAVLRRDTQALSQARLTVRGSNAEGFDFVDRTLAGLALQLTGAPRAAAESLATLDLNASAQQLFGTRDPLARSIAHLTASRLLLQQGDTLRAIRLLTWHEADMGPREDSGWFQLFAPIAYFELARIEAAQGRTEMARDHYQQFLRRFDAPVPALRPRVAEARTALQRLTALPRIP